jgi:hypothetical protein
LSVWLYIGPPQPELLAFILGMFGKAVQLEGDDFVGLSSEQDQLQQRKELASQRCKHASDDKLLEMDICDSLPSGQRGFWHQYERLREERQGARGSFTADCSQYQTLQPRCGAWLPSVATSSELRSLSKKAAFTPQELDFSMGYPSIEGLEGCRAYSSCMSREMYKRAWNSFKRVLGNGVHLPCQAIWMLTILAHMVRRDDFQQWKPPLRIPIDARFSHLAVRNEQVDVEVAEPTDVES